MKEYKYIGKSITRKDAIEKVTGSAKYVEDLSIEPMLYAKTKTSNISHGIIKRIDVSRAKNLPGVKAVVTGKDFPNIAGLYLVDRTFYAVDKVRYWGEPVAGVAAISEDIAKKAIDLIEVEYEELPAVHNPFDAIKPDAPLIHENLSSYEIASSYYPKYGTNISNHFKLRKGDVVNAFKEADYVVEKNYHVPHIQHVCMETHKAAARWDINNNLTIWSSAQSPFTVRKILSKSFGLSLNKIRVVSNYLGGGFGSKGGVIIEGLVIPLAKLCLGYTVRLVCSREQDIQSTTVRTALYSKIKTGVMKNGKIVAMEYEMYWDGGAYNEYAVNVARAAGYSSTGAYNIPNVKTDSYCVYTNNPVGSGMRGFGMPEIQWGIERHMDIMAKDLNIDPLKLRLINAAREGSKTATKQKINKVAFEQCLEKAAESIGWKQNGNRKQSNGKYYGKGIAGLVKAPAQPTNASSSAVIYANEDGTINILVGATEMGQGMQTAMSQIAAEALNIPVEKIEINTPDTKYSPYDWQTVGSRTTYSTGNAIIDAAEDLKKQIFNIASIALDVPKEELIMDNDIVYFKKDKSVYITLADVVSSYKKDTGEGVAGPIIGKGSYVPNKLTYLDSETGEGDPGLFWTYGATAAEVEVDPETGEVKVLQIVSSLDLGKAINPALCQVQINGGTIMGFSNALFEEVLLDNGRVMNPSFTDYKIANIENTPPIKPIIIECPEIGAPYGARGIGEMPIIGVPPAIANAISAAIGIELYSFPFTPEKVYKSIKNKNASTNVPV